MYTQCPECEAAFRVTADVLKVAAGMVRCGSCSHAFNSLDYLSEEKPRPKKPEIQLPELKPEPDDEPDDPRDVAEGVQRSEPHSGRPDSTEASAQGAALEARKPPPRPQSISAEQSAALLKTLDQLAGDDIRIEDTGVEWRVLGDDDASDNSSESESEADLLNDPGVTNAFFIGDIERYSEAAREDARAAENILHDDVEDIDEDLSQDAHDETHVDMDADVAEVFADNAETNNEPYAQTGIIDGGVFNPLQTHVDEILHDSETPIHELVAPSTSEDMPSNAEEDVLRFDDNTPLPDDFLDEDSDEPAPALSEPTIDDSQSFDASVTLGNPDEWQQLLNDFDDLMSGSDSEQASTDDEQITDVATTADAAESNAPEHAPAADSDVRVEEVKPPAADASGDDWDQLPQIAAHSDTKDEEASVDETSRLADTDHADSDLEYATDSEPVAESDDDSWMGDPAEEKHDDSLDLSQILDPDDDGLVDAGESDPVRDDSDLPDVLNFGDDDGARDNDGETDDPKEQASARMASDEFDIPELSEEEQTINMLIDQDLLSIAREDEDGFRSTIVFEKDVDPLSDSSITMRGGSRMEEAILSGDSDDQDGDEPIPALENQPDVAEVQTDKPRKSMWLAAAAVLVIALGAQAIHQTRDQLATNPTFRSLLAPVYDVLGMPLAPDWDVSGWAIERTQGATDGTDQLLTIISELRNRSGTPMPYPIITVSLTDRSQDPVGSLVVEPKDYLPDASAGDSMVAGGMQFQARIPVDAPPGEASGYTINACYRVSGNILRCANEDFLR